MMKGFFSIQSFKQIFLLVFCWRILLFVIAIAAVSLYTKNSYPFPYTDSILIPTGLPKWIWGFANFDGVHYIRTGLWGYVSEYSQAFFPLYPLLIWIFSFWSIGFDQRLVLLINGLIISFVSFSFGLFILQKVYELEIPKKHITYSLLLFLLFPTSFYFAAVYTESLFLLLSVSAIYLILKKKYLYAGIFIGLATATRITGIFLLIIYLIEVTRDLYLNKKTEHPADLFSKLFGLVISCFGLFLYMFFLYFNFNNPIYFLTAQPLFGAERQVDSLVLLPQVFYRYLKILATVPIYSAQFFTAVNEFIFSLFGLLLLVISFKKVRISFWLFSFAVYLLPTLTGTLSSMPRYVLLLFLLFPVLAIFTEKFKKIILMVFILLQIIFVSLFVLGFWIA